MKSVFAEVEQRCALGRRRRVRFQGVKTTDDGMMSEFGAVGRGDINRSQCRPCRLKNGSPSGKVEYHEEATDAF